MAEATLSTSRARLGLGRDMRVKIRINTKDNVFTVIVSENGRSWVVRRSYEEFSTLNEDFKKVYVPSPSKIPPPDTGADDVDADEQGDDADVDDEYKSSSQLAKQHEKERARAIKAMRDAAEKYGSFPRLGTYPCLQVDDRELVSLKRPLQAFLEFVIANAPNVEIVYRFLCDIRCNNDDDDVTQQPEEDISFDHPYVRFLTEQNSYLFQRIDFLEAKSERSLRMINLMFAKMDDQTRSLEDVKKQLSKVRKKLRAQSSSNARGSGPTPTPHPSGAAAVFLPFNHSAVGVPTARAVSAPNTAVASASKASVGDRSAVTPTSSTAPTPLRNPIARDNFHFAGASNSLPSALLLSRNRSAFIHRRRPQSVLHRGTWSSFSSKSSASSLGSALDGGSFDDSFAGDPFLRSRSLSAADVEFVKRLSLKKRQVSSNLSRSDDMSDEKKQPMERPLPPFNSNARRMETLRQGLPDSSGKHRKQSSASEVSPAEKTSFLSPPFESQLQRYQLFQQSLTRSQSAVNMNRRVSVGSLSQTSSNPNSNNGTSNGTSGNNNTVRINTLSQRGWGGSAPLRTPHNIQALVRKYSKHKHRKHDSVIGGSEHRFGQHSALAKSRLRPLGLHRSASYSLDSGIKFRDVDDDDDLHEFMRSRASDPIIRPPKKDSRRTDSLQTSSSLREQMPHVTVDVSAPPSTPLGSRKGSHPSLLRMPHPSRGSLSAAAGASARPVSPALPRILSPAVSAPIERTRASNRQSLSRSQSPVTSTVPQVSPSSSAHNARIGLSIPDVASPTPTYTDSASSAPTTPQGTSPGGFGSASEEAKIDDRSPLSAAALNITRLAPKSAPVSPRNRKPLLTNISLAPLHQHQTSSHVKKSTEGDLLAMTGMGEGTEVSHPKTLTKKPAEFDVIAMLNEGEQIARERANMSVMVATNEGTRPTNIMEKMAESANNPVADTGAESTHSSSSTDGSNVEEVSVGTQTMSAQQSVTFSTESLAISSSAGSIASSGGSTPLEDSPQHASVSVLAQHVVQTPSPEPLLPGQMPMGATQAFIHQSQQLPQPQNIMGLPGAQYAYPPGVIPAPEPISAIPPHGIAVPPEVMQFPWNPYANAAAAAANIYLPPEMAPYVAQAQQAPVPVYRDPNTGLMYPLSQELFAALGGDLSQAGHLYPLPPEMGGTFAPGWIPPQSLDAGYLSDPGPMPSTLAAHAQRAQQQQQQPAPAPPQQQQQQQHYIQQQQQPHPHQQQQPQFVQQQPSVPHHQQQHVSPQQPHASPLPIPLQQQHLSPPQIHPTGGAQHQPIGTPMMHPHQQQQQQHSAAIHAAPAAPVGTAPMGKQHQQQQSMNMAMGIPERDMQQFLRRHDIANAISSVVRRLTPSPQAEATRQKVTAYIGQVVWKAIGSQQHAQSTTPQVYPLGSYALKTYLPDGDINLSAFFSHSRTSTWAERVTEEFMKVSNKRGAGAITDPQLKIGNVSFVNGDSSSKMVKAQIGDISLQVSANLTDGLCANMLFEECDRKIGKNHLMKRTILLAKAWLKNEVPVISHEKGVLSSHALRVMVLFIFNAFHAEIDNPLTGLLKLCRYLVTFDWSRFAFSLYGPVPLERLAAPLPGAGGSGMEEQKLPDPNMPPLSLEQRFQPLVEGADLSAWPRGVQQLITRRDLARHSDEYGIMCGIKPPISKSTEPESFAIGPLNIIGPINPFNNLAKNVTSAKEADVVRSGFVTSANTLINTISNAMASGGRYDPQALMTGLFHNTLDRYMNYYPMAAAQQAMPGGAQRDTLSGSLQDMSMALDSARQYDIPRFISEDELVNMIRGILLKHARGVPIGQMGSLLHTHTNLHSLPTMLKERYGGLKKFVQRHPDVFALAEDHRYNPTLKLVDQQHQHQSTPSTAPPHHQQHQSTSVPTALSPRTRQRHRHSHMAAAAAAHQQQHPHHHAHGHAVHSRRQVASQSPRSRAHSAASSHHHHHHHQQQQQQTQHVPHRSSSVEHGRYTPHHNPAVAAAMFDGRTRRSSSSGGHRGSRAMSPPAGMGGARRNALNMRASMSDDGPGGFRSMDRGGGRLSASSASGRSSTGSMSLSGGSASGGGGGGGGSVDREAQVISPLVSPTHRGSQDGSSSVNGGLLPNTAQQAQYAYARHHLVMPSGFPQQGGQGLAQAELSSPPTVAGAGGSGSHHQSPMQVSLPPPVSGAGGHPPRSSPRSARSESHPASPHYHNAAASSPMQGGASMQHPPLPPPHVAQLAPHIGVGRYHNQALPPAAVSGGQHPPPVPRRGSYSGAGVGGHYRR